MIGGIIGLFLILFLVTVGLLVFAFWIWMLIDAIQNKGLTDGEKSAGCWRSCSCISWARCFTSLLAVQKGRCRWWLDNLGRAAARPNLILAGRSCCSAHYKK